MEVSTYQRLMCSCSYDGRSNGRDAIEGCNAIYNDRPIQYYNDAWGWKKTNQTTRLLPTPCIDIVDIRDYKGTMSDHENSEPNKQGEED